ncbi:adenosylmethionine decarboxylase [bacterium]|nr:adenosylmethionine decarboxylase [bacterium]
MLIDVFEVPFEVLDNEKLVLQCLIRAASKAGATILHSFVHHFEPHGVSCVVVISESHFSIHTWPERLYAAVDLFTCGDSVDLDVAVQEILQFLKGNPKVLVLERGDVHDRRLGTSPDFRFV